jgi:hypothetical protein
MVKYITFVIILFSGVSWGNCDSSKAVHNDCEEMQEFVKDLKHKTLYLEGLGSFLNEVSIRWSMKDVYKFFDKSVHENKELTYLIESNSHLGKFVECLTLEPGNVESKHFSNAVVYRGICKFTNNSAKIEIALTAVKNGYHVISLSIEDIEK